MPKVKSVPKVGRRPGETSTRDAILAAARQQFLEQGYSQATIRAIARAAEVDPALVYHFFGDKPSLFVASMHLPVDPRRVQEKSHEGGFSGAALVEEFLAQWETGPDPPGQLFVATAQAMAASPEVARTLREFLTERVWSHAMPESGRLIDESRHALIASQLFGIAWVRYILQIEPVASASRKEVAAMVGPTIERYGQQAPG